MGCSFPKAEASCTFPPPPNRTQDSVAIRAASSHCPLSLSHGSRDRGTNCQRLRQRLRLRLRLMLEPG